MCLQDSVGDLPYMAQSPGSLLIISSLQSHSAFPGRQATCQINVQTDPEFPMYHQPDRS